MKIVSVRPQWLPSLLMAVVCSLSGSGTSGERREVHTESRALVVPATISRYGRISGSMGARAVDVLRDLDYETVSAKTTSDLLRQANPNNVQACLDKTMIALGRAAKADLIVCPRVFNHPAAGVRVTFARVSKGRVWSCEQPVKTGSGADTEDYLDAVAFCMDQLLSSAPETTGTARKKKKVVISQRRESSRKNYLGAAGLIVPVSRERFTGYDGEQRFSKHFDYGFSGGASLFYERRNLSWIAVGLQLDWYSLGNRKSSNSSAEVDERGVPLPGADVKNDARLNAFNIAAGLRVFYPGKWVEPYLKAALGIAIAAARQGDIYNDIEIGAGIGANYQLRAGLMAIFSYLGIFADLGLVDLMWIPSTEAYVVFDSAMVNDVCLVFTLGVAAVF